MQKKIDYGVGIIIPTLNEEGNIREIINRIEGALRDMAHTICLVDDGSKDKTIQIVEKLAKQGVPIHVLRRKKIGAGCQRGGASLAGLTWLLDYTDHGAFTEVDADGAHRPEEIISGVNYIFQLGFDVAIASKYVYGSQVTGRPQVRRLVSRVHSLIARILVDGGIRDYSNSFRFYSRTAGKLIVDYQPRNKSPIYLFEILVIWICRQLTIIEIPTLYIERSKEDSKVTLVDLVKGFIGMVGIGLRYRAGMFMRSPGKFLYRDL